MESESKAFTPEEVDKIIGEHLAREKARYAEYVDIKAKADKCIASLVGNMVFK